MIHLPFTRKQDLYVLADVLVEQRLAEAAQVVAQGVVLSGIDEGICPEAECREVAVAVLDELGYEVSFNTEENGYGRGV